MHVIAAKAVAFKEALSEEFKEYQKQIVKNCKAMAKRLLDLGYVLVGGRTENHLLIVNMKKSLGITGKLAENILDKVGITCNKNTVPFDDEKPFIASGIRIGTAAITTRGFKEQECIKVADLIDKALRNYQDETVLNTIHQEVKRLTNMFGVN